MRELNTNFRDSVQDLVWMLERGYPKKPAIEAVGNRYRLNHDERMILYRGIFDLKTAECRRKKLVDPFKTPAGKLLIDGYNVFITILSYLKGMCVFRAFDGYVRDVSEVFGNLKIESLARRCIELIVTFIKHLHIREYISVLFDTPKSVSRDIGKLYSYLEKDVKETQQSISVRVVNSVDKVIVRDIRPDTTVSTSDTEIIEKAEKIIDIPYHIITKELRGDILDLRRFFPFR
jgi:hypothetical protein